MTQDVLTPALKISVRGQRSLTNQLAGDRNVRADIMSLSIPLVLLALIGVRVVMTGTLDYINNPASPGYGYGDLYRYVNMALPNGQPLLTHETPFVYRILVPLIVHGLSLVGVPFRTGFFTITSIALTISTIAIFYLVRGAGLSRREATCGAIAFVTLYWSVIYNFHDYFLIDASAQAFVVAILLAVQREKYGLAAWLAAIGIVCNERIYVAIAVGIIQLLLPYLRPLPQTIGALARLRVASVVRRVPRRAWLYLLLLLALPLTATAIVHTILHPIDHTTQLDIWKAYIPAHLKYGVVKSLAILIVVGTLFTYGALFVAALGAFALRVWPRTRFSIWAMLSTLLIIAYSYTLSGDNQRLSILGWPFVILCAAVALHEVAARLRMAVVALWALVLTSQLIFQPALDKKSTFIPQLFRGLILQHSTYIIVMVVAAAMIGVLIVLAWLRSTPTAYAIGLAGVEGATTLRAPDGHYGDQATRMALAVPIVTRSPPPNDHDSQFWVGFRGGITALAGRCLWLANERLQTLRQDYLIPMTARAQQWDATQLSDPRWRPMLVRWQPAAMSAAALWQVYQDMQRDYQSLRANLDLPLSTMPALERDALTLLDIELRQQQGDGPTVLTRQTLSVVLPAYNEESIIANTVQECLRTMRRTCPNAEIIVVDVGSHDHTGVIADELAARDARIVALHNHPNKGYGGALLTGFAASRGEWIFFMDSDGQFDITQIADLFQAALAHPGAAVLGYREVRHDPLVRRLNAWGWKQLVGLLLGLRGIRDIDCAFKLFPAALVRACDVQAQGAMVNTEMLIKLQRMHVPIVQVPVRHFKRSHGRATGANINVIVRAFQELLHLRVRLHAWQPPTPR